MYRYRLKSHDVYSLCVVYRPDLNLCAFTYFSSFFFLSFLGICIYLFKPKLKGLRFIIVFSPSTDVARSACAAIIISS